MDERVKPIKKLEEEIEKYEEALANGKNNAMSSMIEEQIVEKTDEKKELDEKIKKAQSEKVEELADVEAKIKKAGDDDEKLAKLEAKKVKIEKNSAAEIKDL